MYQSTKKLDFNKNYFEKKAWENNLYVCGIDEVGRGCLAGPVVTAAAILPKNTFNKKLQDSKKLSLKQREKSFDWIKKNCFYSISVISNNVIDKINIYQATLLAMKKSYMQLIESMPIALEQLKYVLIDAMPLQIPKSYKHKNLEKMNFNYGESISPSIAAASIVAKVTRDRIMDKFNPIFPYLYLEKHKGYGTEKHTNAIAKNGLSVIHRKTFILKKKEIRKNAGQQTIFGGKDTFC